MEREGEEGKKEEGKREEGRGWGNTMIESL